jgi:hypothetical protein
VDVNHPNESPETKLARLDERVSALERGYRTMVDDLKEVKESVNAILVTLGKVDVKQAAITGGIVIAVNIIALYAPQVVR